MDAGRSNSIQKLKEFIDIVDLIGEFVSLKRAGRRYVGLCPFHTEKTPSFFVDPQTQFFYCFGCNTGGDAIRFIMRYKGFSFNEAVSFLAKRYNVPVDISFHSKKEGSEKLLELIEIAENFFYHQLRHSKTGEIARKYLEKRGVIDKVIEEQRLGYAPPGWKSLVKHFTEKNLDLRKGVEIGLFGSSSGGYYDKFRNRLIFPIRDTRGYTVAFGGRILDSDVSGEPKYLNSPESSIYQKRNLLYQFHLAQEACRKEGREVLLVEGYMDALAFHNVGFYRVVATLGTAFTAQQARLIKRIADEVILVYDGDDAGRKAMIRIFPFLVQEGLKSSCVVLPEGMDPDDFLKNHSLEDFQKLLQSRKDLGEFVIEEFLKTWDGTSRGKMAVLENIFPYIKNIAEPVPYSEYVSLLASRLGLSEQIVIEQFGTFQKKISKDTSYNFKKAVVADTPPLEEEILRIVLKYPFFVDELLSNERVCLLIAESSPVYAEIFNALKETRLEFQERQDNNFYVNQVYEKLADTRARDLISRLLLEGGEFYSSQEIAEVFLKDYLEALKKRLARINRESLIKMLVSAEKKGDFEVVKNLLREICLLGKEGFFPKN